ncbi:MAG: CvpA family protein [Candidatus Obscuribacterales bacterium]|nr:CvpA family protein [Candidatus Obscuribacterales bacterium]
MFWDGLTTVLAIILIFTGWKRGFLASLPGPVSIVAATLITQHIYIDFSQWLSAQLRLDPLPAVTAGYIMCWLSLETGLELVIGMFLKGRFIEHTPIVLNQFAGGVWGLVKAAIIVVLPLMAISVDIKIPTPPKDVSGLIAPEIPAESDSIVMPMMRKAAESLLPSIGKFVVSTDAPSFEPKYEKREVEE